MPPGLQRCVDRVGLVDRDGGGESEVLDHERVGDRHDLPEHVVRCVGQADVVAVALAHLLGTVGPLQQRQGQTDLGLHAELLHEFSAGEQVEELVGAAELDIGGDHHRVVRLHDRIQELVKSDRPMLGIAL